MAASSNPNLPPLPELVKQVDFPVYGLGVPYLGLQLRSLHYGIEEENKDLVGLGLFYAQRYLGSPQVLAVESSVIPANLDQEDKGVAVEWSWANLVILRDSLFRLHTNEPAELLDDEVVDRRFQESIEEIQNYPWAVLTSKSATPLLVGLEVSRGDRGEILSRRFDGRQMLLTISIGLEPDQFVAAIKQFALLRENETAAHRHQEEFERLMQG
jgi:hypothetical protein